MCQKRPIKIKRDLRKSKLTVYLRCDTHGTDSHSHIHILSLSYTRAHFHPVRHTTTHCNSVHPHKKFFVHSIDDASRCNTLQHTAAHCGTLQHTATHCNSLCTHRQFFVQFMMYRVATNCNKLQQAATHCNTLQCTSMHFARVSLPHRHSSSRSEGSQCTTIQHTATHCNAVQCTSTLCNSLR